MAGTPIPWPVSARPRPRSAGAAEGQGDILNLYATKVGDEIQWKRAPGLRRWTPAKDEASRRIPRGTLPMDNYLLTAWTGGMEAVTLAGTVVPLQGELAGSRPVTMARNMRAIPEVAVVTESGAYLANLDTMTVGQYPLTDVSAAQDGSQMVDNLGFVNSVDYFAGYFIFSRPDGTIVASDLQNATIPDLSFDKAEQASDGLLRVVNNGETLLAMGQRTIEVWQDVGKTPFPLARSTVLPVGLLGQFAVAGGPQVWDRGLLFVANDFTVRQLNGYDPVIVSNEAVSRDLYSARFEGELLRAMVYAFQGQAIWSLTHPEWTWEYNLSTGGWHRRESFGQANWRASWSSYWGNRWLAQDTLKDGLVEIDPTVYAEDGERLLARLESAPLKDFPVSVRIPALFFDFEVGLGRASAAGRSGFDPAVQLSWSHDGTATWSNPLVRSLGRQGQRSKLVRLNNIGRSSHRGVALRWETTDPVDITFRQAVAPAVSPSRARQVKA